MRQQVEVKTKIPGKLTCFSINSIYSMITGFASTTVFGEFQFLSNWVFFIQFNCKFLGH